MFPFPIVPQISNEVDAANFDGSNDYCTRGAALTGVSSSKLFTFVAWVDSTVAGAEQRIFISADPLGGTNSVLNIRKTALNSLEVLGENATATPILNISTTGNALSAGWKCVMCSCDMSDTGKRHIYFNDSNVLGAGGIYTNDTLDFVSADWIVGARGDGANKFTGGIAELMFFPGVYVDFSQEVNRRLFYSSVGKPVYPPSAAFSVLGAPAVYLHLGNGETANNFAANDDGGATGGTFTVTGALSTYASSPSD